MITLTDVYKSYTSADGRVLVLDGLSMHLDRGEFGVIVGRSGSGKSTLLNLIGGLDRPDSGSVQACGRELGRLSARELSDFRLRHIGLVFQFFNLLPTLTLEENISLPAYIAGMRRAEVKRRLGECLALVELGGASNRRPHEVSGGEAQRAAIARALMNRPGILLADEPTGNLDRKNRENILVLFARLAETAGVTVLAVTHDAAFETAAEKIFHLEDGKFIHGAARSL